MKRTLVVVAAVVGFATAAGASTLSVFHDDGRERGVEHVHRRGHDPSEGDGHGDGHR
jgi:hypothetical protein